jgi:DNA-binding response OmpR family regulator/tetratricopeptide (TPR) repeat protein
MLESAKHALVFGDDLNVRARLARLLQSAGIKLEIAGIWDRALKLASKQRFDIGVVALSDSLSAAKLEELQRHLPKMLALTTGGDKVGLSDPSRHTTYLRMPVSDDELLDRLHKMLVPEERAARISTVAIGDCRINFDSQSFINANGCEVPLTLAETALLKELARNPGQVCTRDQLRQAIAGRGADRFDRSVDMLVARLRQKIEADPKSPRFIMTTPRVGYRLVAEPASDSVRHLTSKPLDAEKRQLTILSCKIAHWPTYASDHDPEDLSDISQQFLAAANGAVARVGGTIFSQKPEAFFAYFCYPESTEHDAECALGAALDLMQRVGELPVPGTKQLHLQVGIATGLVVLSGNQAVGEPIDVAAALRDATAPNSMSVDANTRKLAEGHFEFKPVDLPGIAGVNRIFAFGVVAQRVNGSGVNVSLGRPLIGRDSELRQLLRLWERAKHWHGQVAVLSGDPGIGKSHLCETFIQRISEQPLKLVRYECRFLLRNSPFHPVITQIERAAAFAPEDSSATKLEKLKATLFPNRRANSDELPLYSDLLSIDSDHDSVHRANTKASRDRLIDRLAQHVAQLAIDAPLLVVVEDAGWADSSTVQFLERFVHALRSRRVLLLLQCRPEYAPAWLGAPHVSILSIDRLARDESFKLLSTIPSADNLPETVKNEIVLQSDGVPLFIEEITKNALETASLNENEEDHLSAGKIGSGVDVPLTLLGPLTARLDRLGPAKEIAQIAAVVGRECSYALLHQVAGGPNDRLDEALRRLEASGLMHRRGAIPNAIYTFKHALVREAAYSTLLKVRRRQLHDAIASALAIRANGLTQTQPDVIAHHYSQAEKHREALDYWVEAAKHAAKRSAHKEAFAHLKAASEELPFLDDARERHKAEVAIQTMLGNSLRAREGWAAEKVKAAYSRAVQLCTPDTPNELTFGPLFGLWAWHFVRPVLPEAQELAERLIAIARCTGSPEYEVLARHAVGSTFFAQGKFEAADVQLERCIALCDDRHVSAYYDLSGQDPRVHARLYRAMVLCFLGLPHRASALAQEALQYADSFQDPFSEAMARTIGLRISQFRGEAALIVAQADAVIDLCKEYEFVHYLAMNFIVRGWARATQGEFEDGIADLLEGLRIQRNNGALILETYTMGLLGDACIKHGRYEQALGFLQQAARNLDGDHSARFYAAEIYRLLGEAKFRLTRSQTQAEQFFSKGLALAREQKARSLELKLYMSLCELYQSTPKAEQFRNSLQELLSSFHERYDTLDLIRAKAILEMRAASESKEASTSRAM